VSTDEYPVGTWRNSPNPDPRQRHDRPPGFVPPSHVRTFTPEEIASMNNNPTRINITQRDADEKTLVIRGEGDLSFDAQKEEVRRLNSIMLARIGAKLAGKGADDDVILSQLSKCSAIAKQWAAEERQAGNTGNEDDIAALQRQAKKAR